MGSVLIVDRDRWRSRRFKRALEALGLRADTVTGMDGDESCDLVFVASRMPFASVPSPRKAVVIGMFMGPGKVGRGFDFVVKTVGDLKFFIDSMCYFSPGRGGHAGLECPEGAQ